MFLFFLAACLAPQMVNKTQDPWTDHDRETVLVCQKRCPELYTDSPCLKQFIKFDFQAYDCICGKA